MSDGSNGTDNGSPTRVAFDLWLSLRPMLPAYQQGAASKAAIKEYLTLYASCLKATRNGIVDVSALPD